MAVCVGVLAGVKEASSGWSVMLLITRACVALPRLLLIQSRSMTTPRICLRSVAGMRTTAISFSSDWQAFAAVSVHLQYYLVALEYCAIDYGYALESIEAELAERVKTDMHSHLPICCDAFQFLLSAFMLWL